MALSTILWLCIACYNSISIIAQEDSEVPLPEPYYGTLVGSLSDPDQIGIKGDVYIINMTTLQIIGFQYSGEVKDLYFCLDNSPTLADCSYKIITFEFGHRPVKAVERDRVVLWSSPDATVNSFSSIGLWSESEKKSYSTLSIPNDVRVPSAQFLLDELRPTAAGRRYNVYSGPIMVMDRRRLKIFGFKFDTVRAPRTHLYVGRGLEPKKHNGKPVPIRGFESPNYVPAIHQAYIGDEDIILELPENYDIYHIDWISVFCSQFNIDFGHVKISSSISAAVPPYVPLQRKHDQKEPPPKRSWPLNVLTSLSKAEFTFQLGPPGFDVSYGKWARAEPAKWLWYVNGYMTPQIWLQREITYTFIVEAGDQPNEYGQINALYITNSSIGGYGVLSDEEKKNVAIYAGLENGKPLNGPSESSFGRNCSWISRSPTPADPEQFDSFSSFKRTLRLKCEEGKTAGSFQWTPDESTPGTVYYQSYGAPNMGFEMIVVDKIPSDMLDGDSNLDDANAANYNDLETEEDENEDVVDEDQTIRPGGNRRESSSSQSEPTVSYDNDGSVRHSSSFQCRIIAIISLSLHFLFTCRDIFAR